MRLKLILTVACCLSIAGVKQSPALDGDDLGTLKAAVHDMCVQPDKKGSYLKIEGDLAAGADLRVVGISGTSRITKETWDGIDQRLDRYKTDPRACAISLVAILAPLIKPPSQISFQSNGYWMHNSAIAAIYPHLSTVTLLLDGQPEASFHLSETFGGFSKVLKQGRHTLTYQVDIKTQAQKRTRDACSVTFNVTGPATMAPNITLAPYDDYRDKISSCGLSKL
jgi:hypothetical protein